MQLIAVSPDSEYANEASVIVRLFDAGLARYHLRKPGWTASQCDELLKQLPKEVHSRLSIHQCYELAQNYAVSIHLKDDGSTHPMARSRSLHDLHSQIAGLTDLDYAILSPVFTSITKPGHAPTWTELELREALVRLRGLQVYALGGVTSRNAALALDFGFEGVVLHGALWRTEDPLLAFQSFRKEAA